MRQHDGRLLILIIVITAFAAWVAWPGNPGVNIKLGDRSITREIRLWLGLDLQGGMQVLMKADVPEGQTLDADAMEATRGILENRVDALGVTEPVVQAVGSDRVLVEMPGIQDPQTAIDTLKETGLLEFVDTGSQFLPAGTPVETDYGSVAASEAISPTTTVYHTVLTGSSLKTAQVTFDQTTGRPYIAFALDGEGVDVFAEHTAANIGKYLAIVLDGEVISCPVINSSIPDGEGIIEGQFTLEEAKSMVLQLRYGALPVPLTVLETRSVGPTRGQDSVDKSIRAGIIGLVAVLLFMLIYYRLPGALASLALIIYALITLALYKLIPVTLTLPGIAGFLLSVGMAVDANILIFERMREELRHGRELGRAVDAGFRRAWTSILDSNVSVWITCAILWAFGNSFGANMVKGFAVTLALGVAVSMFTAITVTRTFVRFTFRTTGERLREKRWLLGI
ncbi:MAG: protein translocase subunit SecD [Chloroflexi bacterium]|nr:protein translocase subunit SecD [Chloroflexota bacterium]